MLIDNLKIGLRRLAKASIAYAAYGSGLLDRLSEYRTGIKGERVVIVLGYHRVVKDFNSSSKLAIPSLLISAETFRRHLDLICNNFDLISLDDALQVISGERSAKRDAVVLTFDDGYQDFYNVAYPILRSYGLPAAIFVPTRLIGQKSPLAHDQIYYLIREMAQRNLSVTALLEHLKLFEPLPLVGKALSGNKFDYFTAMRALFEMPQEKVKTLIDAMKNELRFSDEDFPAEYSLLTRTMVCEMASAGVTIGAHTQSHALLTEESPEAAEKEILGSKNDLEQMFKAPGNHFAYPDGRYNKQIEELVKKAGFKSACTIEDRPNALMENPYRIKRKLLWERACMGVFSDFSEIVAQCHLRGLFSNPICKPI